jgi:prophage DNA circulation protein
MTTLRELAPVCTWQAKGGAALAFPVESISEDGGNRLVPHERPYRDGARHDDTGSRPRTYTLRCTFFNGNDEPGVPGEELFPDQLDKLIASFDIHETGTLTLPTRGPRRCRAASYAREDSYTEEDAATVTFNFVEDNEDDVTAASFTAPSARSVAHSNATLTTFSLEAAGVVSDDSNALIGLAQELEDLAASANDTVTDVEEKAGKINRSIERVAVAFSVPTGQALTAQQSLLSDPSASLAARQAGQLRDLASRATADLLSSLPRVVTRTFDRQVSLIAIASPLGQDVEQLLSLNSSYADPLAIPAGRPIRIVESRFG